MVRTGGLTVPAPDAPVIVLAHNARIVIHFGRRRRTDRDTGRVMVAVHAGSREIRNLRFRECLPIVDLVELHPGDEALFVRFVRPGCHIVFGCTGDHAGPATRAFIQINGHAVFKFPLFLFHEYPLFVTVRLSFFDKINLPTPLRQAWGFGKASRMD